MQEHTTLPSWIDDEALAERQIALEDESIGLGVQRYQRDRLPWAAPGSSRTTPESETMPGNRLVSSGLPAVSQAVSQWMEAALSGKARRNATLARWLEPMEADVIALAALKATVDGMTRDLALSAVARSAMEMLEAQAEHDIVKASAEGWYKGVWGKMKANSTQYKRRVLRKAADDHGLQVDRLDTTDRVKLGRVLIDLACQHTGVAEVYAARVARNKTVNRLRPTDQAMDWLQDAHKRCETLFPVMLPMIHRPKPWTDPWTGGYLSEGMGGTKLVKTTNRSYVEELADHPMPRVYAAVNAVQDTAWKINGGVLKIMQTAWDAGDQLAGLPARERDPLPPKPGDIDTNEESRKAWRRRAAEVYGINTARVGKVAAVAQKLWIAARFSEESAIWFPHTLDWRGRVYPLPSLVHPQGDDVAKGLLTFSEGKPLGDIGGFWLGVHLANLAGYDKVSFDDRYQWALDHEEQILDSAMNPLDGSRFWAQQENPWQFLAASLEWLGYSVQGPAYVSHLPIAMDGSCSGLQHYSAMLRDAVGGEATNLTPSETPQDIYGRVAELVDLEVTRRYEAGEEQAGWWVGTITRKTVKRPTMTLPYGVTNRGMVGQIKDDLDKARAAGKELLNEDANNMSAAVWLAPLVSEAIGSVVRSAEEAMGWLQSVAQLVSADGLPLYWTAPSGLLVCQAYRQTNDKIVKALFGGTRIKTTVREETQKIDRRKQRAGIAPNFVHSLDAAHLMSTVVHAGDEGIESFAMIHDSFGTHAANTTLLSQVLRETFLEQYTEDALETFEREVRSQLPTELADRIPPRPRKGGLDLGRVVESQYFFA